MINLNAYGMHGDREPIKLADCLDYIEVPRAGGITITLEDGMTIDIQATEFANVQIIDKDGKVVTDYETN